MECRHWFTVDYCNVYTICMSNTCIVYTLLLVSQFPLFIFAVDHKGCIRQDQTNLDRMQHCEQKWWGKKEWKGKGSQYMYQDSKLLVPVVYFAELIKTSLSAVWAEQHGQQTSFLNQTCQEGVVFVTVVWTNTNDLATIQDE